MVEDRKPRILHHLLRTIRIPELLLLEDQPHHPLKSTNDLLKVEADLGSGPVILYSHVRKSNFVYVLQPVRVKRPVIAQGFKLGPQGRINGLQRHRC